MDKPLKAYSVLENDENTGDIFFAAHAITARKRGANEYAEGDISCVSCTRAPWADQYAPGPVPFAAKFAHGWWHDCFGCGVTIRDGEEDDDGEPIDFDIVEDGQFIYCTPACKERSEAEEARLAEERAKAILDLSHELLKAMPGAQIEYHKDNWKPYAYVTKKDGEYRRKQCVVSFAFPSAKHGFGSMRYDEIGETPYVTVPFGDQAAFAAWREAGYPQFGDAASAHAVTVNPTEAK